LVDALICYKQKCKVASFNLAHPVHFAIVFVCRQWTQYVVPRGSLSGGATRRGCHFKQWSDADRLWSTVCRAKSY